MNIQKALAAMFAAAGGATLAVNDHLAIYKTAEEYLQDTDTMIDDGEIVGGHDTYRVICERNQVVELRWYPDTPVGYHRLLHYEIEPVLEAFLRRQQEAENE